MISEKGTHANGIATDSSPNQIELHMVITDPELCAELWKRDEPERTEFAASAMRVGIIAFRQAQGQVDAREVMDAGQRVIRHMGDTLEEHRREITRQVSECIGVYFDPQGGQFPQRIKALLGSGEESGELERIIRSQVEGDGSFLSKTLAAFVGGDSQLMRVLDPDSKSGMVARLSESTEATLSGQRERILTEFSLDNQGWGPVPASGRAEGESWRRGQGPGGAHRACRRRIFAR